MKFLIFDTETTGLPKKKGSAKDGPNNWPHIVSISWVVMDDENTIHSQKSYIVKPRWEIPEESTKIHGITYQHAMWIGKDLNVVMNEFLSEECDILVAHNMNFDYNVLVNAIKWDMGIEHKITQQLFCTMNASRNICKIPGKFGGNKVPKLKELYKHIFTKDPIEENLHGSEYDTQILVEIIKESKEIRDLLINGYKGNNHGDHQNSSGILSV